MMNARQGSRALTRNVEVVRMNAAKEPVAAGAATINAHRSYRAHVTVFILCRWSKPALSSESFRPAIKVVTLATQ